MGIPLAIEKKFGTVIRQWGMEYYYSGKIKNFSVHGNRVVARVQGKSLYEVDIVLSGISLGVYCECEYHKDHIYCKHIWAVLWRIYISKVFPTDKLMKILYVVECFDESHEDWDEYIDDDKSEIRIDNKSINQNDNNKSNSPLWKSLFSDNGVQLINDELEKQKYFFYYLRIDRATVNSITVDLVCRIAKSDGSWSEPFYEIVNNYKVSKYGDKRDQTILSILLGKNQQNGYLLPSEQLSKGPVSVLVPMMAETGRLYIVGPDGTESGPVNFDKTIYSLTAVLEKADSSRYQISCKIVNQDQIMDTSVAASMWIGGLIYINGAVAKLDCGESIGALFNLRRQGIIYIENEQISNFLSDYYSSAIRMPMIFPEELQIPEVSITPVPCLRFLKKDPFQKINYLIASVYFDYSGTLVDLNHKDTAVYNKKENKAYIINREFHRKSIVFIYQSGIVLLHNDYYDKPVAKITKKQFVPLVKKLLENGWRVEGEKGVFRKPGTLSVNIKSGEDWFDLKAAFAYDNTYVPLPKLLSAIKKGEQYVILDDGTLGLLPEEWLKKYGTLTSMGELQDDNIRFKRSQALLIDTLIADEREKIQSDEIFDRIRSELTSFVAIEPLEPSESMNGILRFYQKEGLGWLSFLERFGLGGCLADDMGLGKTVQVLAHLEKRRYFDNEKKKSEKQFGTSLVVAPRSLIFNWIKEAQKFTPLLKVLDFSGDTRTAENVDFSEYDLVLVTYGTLRRDITRLREFVFDYVILDEAQVIKNAKTITAKSACLLHSKNRLALSGTPVENHLGDLWSIFEFLNPGILGCSAAFSKVQKMVSSVNDNNCDLLRTMLKPFILRRTKSQVASDLPERTEEIVLCEMEPAQKKIYDELKKYYQANLIKKVEIQGLNKSKIMILEALLRLRQAACHPGLIDKKNTEITSVKLETLVSQIEELRDEGHKCIVFSQFTSMLALVKERLDKTSITYEYLDGTTVDREKRVERFQKDPLCSVFLISLKAGGVGLNLTAAEYVFIFDPWWNPAVEAQAIDRTHRIGQKKPVFAYRMICKNTVEEKVLNLQSKKKKLAESIISNDQSLIRDINIDDLKLLFG